MPAPGRRSTACWPTAAVLLGVICGLACDSLDPRAPRGLALAAASDSTVLLTWTEPADGTPEAYLVYFRPPGGFYRHAQGFLLSGQIHGAEQ